MDSVFLMGSEDVRRASTTMVAAAETMQGAASCIQHSHQMHEMFLDDWLSRFEQALQDNGQFGVGA